MKYVTNHNSNVFIIAEAGVNHNGNRDMAFQLVDAAIAAGADAVKFQTFKAENMVTRHASKAEYQQQITGANESQFSMLKRLELDYDTHHDLLAYCQKKNIAFLSTAFDFQSLDFIVNDLDLSVLKIPSGEITNAPLVLAHAQTGKRLILSTGMATLGEVEDALGVIAFGLLNQKNSELTPSQASFKGAYFSPSGQQALQNNVTLLHCTTEYPAPFEDINLSAMQTMRDAFKLRVGYSDHSDGIVVPIAATALGAIVIEKHFTLDKTLPGPDHRASLDPNELKEMVKGIRQVQQVMGDGLKIPRLSELKNVSIARKSLVAGSDIKKGTLICEEHIKIKRSGGGLSPMEYWDLIGTKSQYDYELDEAFR